MSCQRGNASRSRPQKYQNHTVFKNDLHDTSNRTKFVNSIEIADVCERCKKIIEWKIKYKKYKALKAQRKCTKCGEKSIKHAYHIMCLPCAKERKVCPKCDDSGEIVEGKPSREESAKFDAKVEAYVKTLSERERRTFLRYINQKDNSRNILKSDTNEVNDKQAKEDAITSITRNKLLTKLDSLFITEVQEDNSDSDSDDDLK